MLKSGRLCIENLKYDYDTDSIKLIGNNKFSDYIPNNNSDNIIILGKVVDEADRIIEYYYIDTSNARISLLVLDKRLPLKIDNYQILGLGYIGKIMLRRKPNKKVCKINAEPLKSYVNGVIGKYNTELESTNTKNKQTKQEIENKQKNNKSIWSLFGRRQVYGINCKK